MRSPGADVARHTAVGDVAPSSVHRGARRRGAGLGAVAGLIGVSCCVYPVVLVLLGLSSASAAIALGNHLYGEWGWAFKSAAVVFAAVALTVQWRRGRACSLADRRPLGRTALWLTAVGVVTYGVLYGVTSALAILGSGA